MQYLWAGYCSVKLKKEGWNWMTFKSWEREDAEKWDPMGRT